MRWLLQYLLLSDRDRIVEIRSWVPAMGLYGVEWPTMLIDANGYQRHTVSPVWDWPRLKDIAHRVLRLNQCVG